MKRKNFPGRKMQRQIDAAIRASDNPHRSYTAEERAQIDHARTQRNKRR